MDADGAGLIGAGSNEAGSSGAGTSRSPEIASVRGRDAHASSAGSASPRLRLRAYSAPPLGNRRSSSTPASTSRASTASTRSCGACAPSAAASRNTPADPRAMSDLTRSFEVLRRRVELSASCCLASPLELADGDRDSVCSRIARGGEVMVNLEYSHLESFDPTIVLAASPQAAPEGLSGKHRWSCTPPTPSTRSWPRVPLPAPRSRSSPSGWVRCCRERAHSG